MEMRYRIFLEGVFRFGEEYSLFLPVPVSGFWALDGNFLPISLSLVFNWFAVFN
jgi:hypothetical protein